MASGNVRLARYSAAQALQQILRDLDSDSDVSVDESGSDYEDHVSEQSDYSDEERVEDCTVNPVSVAADVHEASSSAAIGVRRGRGRGRARGRGRGRESVSSIQVQRSESTPLVSALYGKNNFVWTSDPPAVGRRREQDIIRTSPGLTAAASANNISEAFQLFITHEIISNVVLQTNREARRRIRDWNEQHPSDLRPDWNAVSDDEMMAFLGLCILAGAYRSRHEPVSVLWSDREGRPAFTATMSRNRFTDILKYIRFDDKSTRESRLASDKLAPFRDIWIRGVHPMGGMTQDAS
jgi:hypothetical protein